MKGGDIDQFIQQQTDMVGNNMFSTFLLVKAGTDPKRLEQKFPAFINKHLGQDLKVAGFQKKQFLLAARDMHLYAGVPNNISPVGSVTYLYILGSIAFFTLLIACINFMNLSTARSSKRCVEVGIRKALGADRVSLIRQFMSEAIFLSVVAFLLSLAVTKIILPVFSEISGKHLTIDFSTQWWILACFFGLSIITGLLAGSYPALYLSSFQPVKVLKGRFVSSLSVITLRKGLVIFQFSVSVILIIASVVIMNQMTYMRSADLGFAKDQQIVIPLRSTSAKNSYAPLKSKLENHPFVQNVGASLYYPGILNPSDVKLYREGKP
ncbi:FtsX-like permease family protein [Niabella sp. W65]|nr:FtsX-like permease family protein [Niabella sp. W65]MCH7362567.1 FtsX-like permease family protein [Niabella sp. W65]